ncbi:hypothetical protein [Aneurinibacillus aneurinilyticus]|jgi:hypothetical protein|uniref:Uncharacterized protein n=2 Tax=Aneurinibacillus aneurinilyticus TaxID=1391 RepID=A0A848CXJ0_ANEAE|nr:hypothetical protein [Aneurinibacillus aneurinilyticus]ERI11449.1 hypothetical protein HMPREF0083_00436 [Aneurinibacillus aneurinilyticus ATCC 12856]MCI1694225.1 hypothetical protein [Aneurinibacillus aneurinilyticus]MED0671335.1 hypothetical protein [Aneurinibacillus aneurinilyticus]MED0707759.1 hypothetical protein [Aneurinibacillus aneurinilyticus]MED0722424.1 hypothetical protein [Aneurinibacillus aneurinilyticus]
MMIHFYYLEETAKYQTKQIEKAAREAWKTASIKNPEHTDQNSSYHGVVLTAKNAAKRSYPFR